MDISNKENGKYGSFIMEDNGNEIGEMTYTISDPGEMTIDHTQVNEDHEGEGLGKQLVKAGVAFARENHLKINPVCPFARKLFDDTPDFADVLA